MDYYKIYLIVMYEFVSNTSFYFNRNMCINLLLILLSIFRCYRLIAAAFRTAIKL